MNKTPLQLAINNIQIEVNRLNADHPSYLAGIELSISILKELLPKEKEVIMSAYNIGCSEGIINNGQSEYAEQYFNNTFNNEESHK